MRYRLSRQLRSPSWAWTFRPRLSAPNLNTEFTARAERIAIGTREVLSQLEIAANSACAGNQNEPEYHDIKIG